MQDPANGLRRIPLPRTSVYKGIEKDRTLLLPGSIGATPRPLLEAVPGAARDIWIPGVRDVAAGLGYTCADLTDPYTAAEAALALYNRDGLSPWAATAY